MSRVCVAAIAVAGVLLLTPAGALADTCQGGSSAVNIYSECIPTAGGGHHAHAHKRAGATPPTTSTTPSYPNTPPATKPQKIKVPARVIKSLSHAGSSKKMLTQLVSDPWLGATHAVETSASFRTAQPSALGAVFDLGSGPTVLFAMLAALAIVLLGVGGLRRRQR